MNSIGSIIAEGRKRAGFSQVELARELNSRFGYEISNKSISKWEKDLAEPGIPVFMDICRVTGIRDPYTAYFGPDPKDPASLLNEAGLERLREYARLLGSDERYKRPVEKVIPFRTIPLQLYPVSAGPGNFLDEENYEDIPVGPEVSASADFAVRVSGDSMEPLLHKNQIIFVHRQDSLENGDLGIFFLNGEAFVKKFQADADGIRLVSLNKKYAPIPVSEDSSFRIFGKLV